MQAEMQKVVLKWLCKYCFVHFVQWKLNMMFKSRAVTEFWKCFCVHCKEWAFAHSSLSPGVPSPLMDYGLFVCLVCPCKIFPVDLCTEYLTVYFHCHCLFLVFLLWPLSLFIGLPCSFGRCLYCLLMVWPVPVFSTLLLDFPIKHFCIWILPQYHAQYRIGCLLMNPAEVTE